MESVCKTFSNILVSFKAHSLAQDSPLHRLHCTATCDTFTQN